MSKLTKFIKTPRLYFKDAIAKKAVRFVDSLSDADQVRFGLSTRSGPLDKVGLTKSDIELAGALIDFEESYPVNALTSGDGGDAVHMWPYLRHFLWTRCQASYKNKNPSGVNTSKMFLTHDWYRHYSNMVDIKTIDQIEEERVDFLFLTNLRGTEQTTIGDRIYNRITDPVFEIASRIGRAKKVELVKTGGVITNDRHHPVEMVYPPMLRRIGFADLCEIPANFVKQVRSKLPETKLDERSLRDAIEWFFAQRDFFCDLLKKYSPKAVFFVGFDYYHALVWAAKEMGVRTVDLQHGVQAGWSPVYRHWNAIPRDGYYLIPDTFWVWGSYDAEKLNESFRSAGENRPDTIIGGFPWLERQEELLERETASAAKILDANRQGKKVGILTLQDQTELPELFREIVTETSSRVFWVVKRHPKHRTIDLSEIAADAVYGDRVDDLSFMALAKAADIHLTECSTSVIEADYYGLPSVVTGEQGMANYTDFIAEGTVCHIESADKFSENLDNLLARKGTSRMGVIETGVTEKALRGILERSK